MPTLEAILLWVLIVIGLILIDQWLQKEMPKAREELKKQREEKEKRRHGIPF